MLVTTMQENNKKKTYLFPRTIPHNLLRLTTHSRISERYKEKDRICRETFYKYLYGYIKGDVFRSNRLDIYLK